MAVAVRRKNKASIHTYKCYRCQHKDIKTDTYTLYDRGATAERPRAVYHMILRGDNITFGFFKVLLITKNHDKVTKYKMQCG